MFGIGMPELIIIMVIALIVIGPQKLPDLAKSLGKGLAEFRKAADDFKANLETESKVAEEKEQPAKLAEAKVGESLPAAEQPKPAAVHAHTAAQAEVEKKTA